LVAAYFVVSVCVLFAEYAVAWVNLEVDLVSGDGVNADAGEGDGAAVVWALVQVYGGAVRFTGWDCGC